jgi:hypothetical protein
MASSGGGRLLSKGNSKGGTKSNLESSESSRTEAESVGSTNKPKGIMMVGGI